MTIGDKIKNVREQAKKEAKKKIDSLSEWVCNNKELTGVIILLTGTILEGAAKSKKYSKDYERGIRDRFYDPRVGEYVYPKRRLSNKERLIIQKLYKKGLSYREILTSMRLIKLW